MTPLLALDPGPAVSGLVVYDPAAKRVLRSVVEPNDRVLQVLLEEPAVDGVTREPGLLVIEAMEARRDVLVSTSTHETNRWAGRFEQRWRDQGGTVRYVQRTKVLEHLRVRRPSIAHPEKSADARVRGACISLVLGPGPRSAIRKGAALGTLACVKSHAWQALGLALAATGR